MEHKPETPALLEQTSIGTPVPQPQRHVALSDIALPQNYTDLVGVITELATAPLKKPNSQSFFAIHQDQSLWITCAMIKSQHDGEHYVLHKDLMPELEGEYSLKMLLPCITKQGNLMFWPVGLPGSDGKLNDWHQSAFNHAFDSKGGWIRLTAVSEANGYSVTKPVQAWNPPIWPEGILELVGKAIQPKLISSMDHPFLQRLRGVRA